VEAVTYFITEQWHSKRKEICAYFLSCLPVLSLF